jgi:hypothetical protein
VRSAGVLAHSNSRKQDACAQQSKSAIATGEDARAPSNLHLELFVFLQGVREGGEQLRNLLQVFQAH